MDSRNNANSATFLLENRREAFCVHKKGTCPCGQVPLVKYVSKLTYASTAACAAANEN